MISSQLIITPSPEDLLFITSFIHQSFTTLLTSSAFTDFAYSIIHFTPQIAKACLVLLNTSILGHSHHLKSESSAIISRPIRFKEP
jgi:hypothetical protein